MQQPDDIITLVCANEGDEDFVKINVSSEAAKHSSTIMDCLCGPVKGSEGEVPIISLDVPSTQLAVKVMEHYKDVPVSDDDDPDLEIEITSWDKENLPNDVEGLIKAFRAANFLNIKQMKMKTGKMLGTLMNDMDVEGLHAILGEVEKDAECYTDDEDIKKRYRWLEKI
jgi:hypothetical protein